MSPSVQCNVGSEKIREGWRRKCRGYDLSFVLRNLSVKYHLRAFSVVKTNPSSLLILSFKWKGIEL